MPTARARLLEEQQLASARRMEWLTGCVGLGKRRLCGRCCRRRMRPRGRQAWQGRCAHCDCDDASGEQWREETRAVRSSVCVVGAVSSCEV